MKKITVGIIDADLLSRSKHRFPNLACMKISSFCKKEGHDVELVRDYDTLTKFDKIYVSKVFTDTQVPEWLLNDPRVTYGGTGFFYDEAPCLPDVVEHILPDYDLYQPWVDTQLKRGIKRNDLKFYLDYSIGFLTRGCFRHCDFCVNKNYNSVSVHSPISEFVVPERKKICLLDDNFLGCPNWKKLLAELNQTGKSFQFRQGLDERLLTDEKCEMLFNSKYDGDYIFAFDNIEDKNIVEEKARMIRHHYKNAGQNIKFYVLCGFDRAGKYDRDFWIQDIHSVFERVFVLAKYNFKPYIMRFEKYQESPFKGTYINLACWCNQPGLFSNLSYKQFCEKDDLRKTGGKKTSATWRYYERWISEDVQGKEYIDVIPKSLKVDYLSEKIVA